MELVVDTFDKNVSEAVMTQNPNCFWFSHAKAHLISFSILSTHPTRGMMYYSIAKAGLDMVTKQFALELAQHNIRVNSVNPTKTITETTPQQLLDTEFLQNLKSFTPMGRFCSMEDVVRPIMYLLSDASGMVTTCGGRWNVDMCTNRKVLVDTELIYSIPFYLGY